MRVLAVCKPTRIVFSPQDGQPQFEFSRPSAPAMACSVPSVVCGDFVLQLQAHREESSPFFGKKACSSLSLSLCVCVCVHGVCSLVWVCPPRVSLNLSHTPHCRLVFSPHETCLGYSGIGGRGWMSLHSPGQRFTLSDVCVLSMDKEGKCGVRRESAGRSATEV